MIDIVSIKAKNVIDYFMSHPTAYIGEISDKTSIPRSSVQRYLKKNEDRTIPGTNKTIREQLLENQRRGNQNGGRSATIGKTPVKDSTGKFTGKMVAEDSARREKKEKDICLICKYYLSNPTITLEELKEVFQETEIYTKGYVYECLTDELVEEVIGKEKYEQIKELLNQNRYSFFRKTEGLDIEKGLEDSCLTEREKKIITLRYRNKCSLEEVAEVLGLSRTRVMIYEDSAIEKMKTASRKGHK